MGVSNNTNVDSRVSDVQLEMLKERLSTCNSDDAASQMFPLFESLRKRAAVVGAAEDSGWRDTVLGWAGKTPSTGRTTASKLTTAAYISPPNIRGQVILLPIFI